MDVRKIGILEGKDFSQTAIDELKKIGHIEFYNENIGISKFISDKEIIFIRLKYYIGEEILKKAQNLKYICSPTTGLNHIDVSIAEKRNIKIVSLKGESNFLETIRATPEHTFGLAISLLRNYKNAFLSKINNDWNREKYKGYELYNMNIGIIGLGRVGNILTKYLKAFNGNVYYYDIKSKINNQYGAIACQSIEDLINKSEMIFLCASYEKKFDSFFGKKYIDLLEGKYFINTSRGELVDEEYLINMMIRNHLKGVALDVVRNENNKNNIDKLIELTKNKNFIITPHIAGATYHSMWKTEEFIVKKIGGLL